MVQKIEGWTHTKCNKANFLFQAKKEEKNKEKKKKKEAKEREKEEKKQKREKEKSDKKEEQRKRKEEQQRRKAEQQQRKAEQQERKEEKAKKKEDKKSQKLSSGKDGDKIELLGAAEDGSAGDIEMMSLAAAAAPESTETIHIRALKMDYGTMGDVAIALDEIDASSLKDEDSTKKDQSDKDAKEDDGGLDIVFHFLGECAEPQMNYDCK